MSSLEHDDDQVQSCPSKEMSSVFSKLGETLGSFEENAVSIVALSEKWQSLQSSFSVVEGALERRGKELDFREGKIVEIERKVEGLLRELVVRQGKVEVGERCVREGMERIELEKREISVCWGNLNVRKRVVDVCEGCRGREETGKAVRGVEVEEGEVREGDERLRMVELREKELREDMELREEEMREFGKVLEARERGVEEGNRVLEERLKGIELREKEVREGIELREKEVEECLRGLEVREKEIEERWRGLEEREKEIGERVNVQGSRWMVDEMELRRLEEKKREFEERCRKEELRVKEIFEGMDLREREMKERRREVELREKEIVEAEALLKDTRREAALRGKEIVEAKALLKEIEGEIRENWVGLREREKELDEHLRKLEEREKAIDERCEAQQLRENEISELMEVREKEMKERGKELALRKKEIDEGDAALKEVRELWEGLEEKKKAMDDFFLGLEKKEKAIDKKYEEHDLKEKELREYGNKLDSREQELHELCGTLEQKEKKLEQKEKNMNEGFKACWKELDLKREHLLEGRRALGVKENEMNEKCKEVVLKQERVKEQLKILELIHKEISAPFKELELMEEDTLEERKVDEKRASELLKELHLKAKQIKVCCNQLKSEVETVTETCMPVKQRETELNQNREVTELKDKQGSAVGSSDIELLCKNMDAKGVTSYLIEHVKDCNIGHERLSKSLRLASDSARLVLEVARSFYQMGFSCIPGDVCPAGCIYLLVQLTKLQPDIRPSVRKEAKEFAAVWRGSLDMQGSAPSEIYCFLQFLASYKLAESFDANDLVSLFGTLYNVSEVYRPEQNAHLCRELGLTNKISGLIKSLITGCKYLQAVMCACAFKMEDTYPPEALIESHLQVSQKRLHEMVNKANHTAQVRAANMELSTLRAVLKCISTFKLASKSPPAPIKLRISELEKKIEEWKEEWKTASGEHDFASSETTSTGLNSDLQTELHDKKKRRVTFAAPLEQQKQHQPSFPNNFIPYSPSSPYGQVPAMLPYGCHVSPHGALPATNWQGHPFGASGAGYGVPYDVGSCSYEAAGVHPVGAYPPGFFPVGAHPPAGVYPVGAHPPPGVLPVGSHPPAGAYPVHAHPPAGVYPIGDHTPTYQDKGPAQKTARSSDSITINIDTTDKR